MNNTDRRIALKALATVIPAVWVKPVITSAVLPVHATVSIVDNPNIIRLTLSGLNEVPPVDNGYSGSGSIFLDMDNDQICIDLILDLSGEDITGLHLHEAPAGANGAVVVNFNENPDTCVAISSELLAAIMAAPEDYYLNVHTANYPAGAVRGQLA